jgi:hypothetical protein
MQLQIAGVVFLVTMLYLASQGDRHENRGITQTEKRNIEEADRTRQVALLDAQDSKRRHKKENPSPEAHRLDDGIQGDIPIGELMEGFRGFL